MKTLVIYASKYGCTEDCVKYLKSKLNHESKVVNLKDLGSTDLQQYDWIIIGSPIYIGKIRKEAKLFCEQNLKTLLTKNITLFVCCTTPNSIDDFFKLNFPAQLLEHSVETVNFGGELRSHKMGFFDKKITAMAAKFEPRETAILYENMDQLANSINEKAANK